MNIAKAERHATIPTLGTKVVWPKTKDTAISYCRTLLHDTSMKVDAYRTGISTSSACDCGHHSETVKHFILHCPKHDSERLQLTDTVGSLWHHVKDDGYAFDLLYFVVAPRSDDIITTKEDSLVKGQLNLVKYIAENKHL